MNRKRFGAESNLIAGSNRMDLLRVCTQEAGPVEPYAKTIMLQTHGLEKYTRTLADVILPDGMNLNQEFFKQG